MHIGHLGKHGDTWVYHDDRELTLFQRLLQAPVDNRVLLREVGTKGHQAVSMFKIFITAGWTIGTEGTFITGYG